MIRCDPPVDWRYLDQFSPHLTTTSVAAALRGFDRPLAPGRDFEWLALAVRRALAVSEADPTDGPKRDGNAETKQELERLAALAGDTWQAIFQRSAAADAQLLRFSFAENRASTDVDRSASHAEPAAYRRFQSALSYVEMLATFLRRAADQIESQAPNWRLKASRDVRVDRARFLAPVFEAAFGLRVTVNNFPNDARHQEPTPFMEFYQRIVALAFQEAATPDISRVLKEARQKHKTEPVCFTEGVIPNL